MPGATDGAAGVLVLLHADVDHEAVRMRAVPVANGGFAQYMAELLTAVKHNMNITHILLNNGQLGKIWQTSLHNPDFSRVAEICGAFGVRVTDAGRLDDAIMDAIARGGLPALVDVISDPELVELGPQR